MGIFEWGSLGMASFVRGVASGIPQLMAAGFLPTRGSFMFDLLFISMFAMGAILIYSVFQVRVKRQFKRHRSIQIGMSLYMLVAVVLFELTLHFGDDWRELAKLGPYYGTEEEPGSLFTALRVHLLFAITTPVVWLITLIGALRKFGRNPAPNDYTPTHKVWGRIAAIDLVLTAITGVVFYWMAFIAN